MQLTDDQICNGIGTYVTQKESEILNIASKYQSLLPSVIAIQQQRKFIVFAANDLSVIKQDLAILFNELSKKAIAYCIAYMTQPTKESKRWKEQFSKKLIKELMADTKKVLNLAVQKGSDKDVIDFLQKCYVTIAKYF